MVGASCLGVDTAPLNMSSTIEEKWTMPRLTRTPSGRRYSWAEGAKSPSNRNLNGGSPASNGSSSESRDVSNGSRSRPVLVEQLSDLRDEFGLMKLIDEPGTPGSGTINGLNLSSTTGWPSKGAASPLDETPSVQLGVSGSGSVLRNSPRKQLDRVRPAEKKSRRWTVNIPSLSHFEEDQNKGIFLPPVDEPGTSSHNEEGGAVSEASGDDDATHQNEETGLDFQVPSEVDFFPLAPSVLEKGGSGKPPKNRRAELEEIEREEERIHAQLQMIREKKQQVALGSAGNSMEKSFTASNELLSARRHSHMDVAATPGWSSFLPPNSGRSAMDMSSGAPSSPPLTIGAESDGSPPDSPNLVASIDASYGAVHRRQDSGPLNELPGFSNLSGYGSKRKPGTDRRHTFTAFTASPGAVLPSIGDHLSPSGDDQESQQHQQEFEQQVAQPSPPEYHVQQIDPYQYHPQSHQQMMHPSYEMSAESPSGYNLYFAAQFGAQPYHAGHHSWHPGYNPYYDPSMDGPVQPLPTQKQETGPPGANLFVFNFPRIFTNDDLHAAFTPFGNILSATVFIDKNTGRSKCFGFVSYDSASDAQSAIDTMNGQSLGGKTIKVQHKREGRDSS